jgi:hypothetical protein
VSNTKIQVRRSVTNSVVTGIANGELAFTSNGTGTAGQGLLYIGDPGGSSPIVIGGKYNFGILTANQAVVTNATSGVNQIIAANLTVLQYLSVNGSYGDAGNILASGGPSANVYWTTAGGGGTVTGIYSGNGTATSSNPITGTGNVYVVANSGIVANATGVHVLANSGIVSNATGVHVVPNTGIVSNSYGVFVNASYIATISANSASYVTNSGISSAYIGTLTANSVTNCPNTAISTSYIATLAANSATYVSVFANGAMISNSSGISVRAGNSTVVNSTGVHVNSTYIATIAANTAAYLGATAAVSNQFTITAGVLSHNTSAVVTLQDLTLGGNLTINGVLTTIDTTNLVVNDNIIIMARNQPTVGGADNVDSGFATAYGNTSNTWYAGIARIKASSTNTNPLFQVFATNTSGGPGSTTLTGLNTGTLQSYLAPWGAGGAMVVNSIAMVLTANGSVSLNLTANAITTGTLSLGTQMAITNLAANVTGGATGIDGTVLQISGTTLTYATLDGGSF